MTLFSGTKAPPTLVVIRQGNIYEHWMGRICTLRAHAEIPLTAEGVEMFRRDPTPFITRESQTS